MTEKQKEYENIEMLMGKKLTIGMKELLLNLSATFPEIIKFILRSEASNIEEAIELFFQEKNGTIALKRSLKSYQEKCAFDNIILYLLLGYTLAQSMNKVHDFENEYAGCCESFIYQYRESIDFQKIARMDGFEPPKHQEKPKKKKKPTNNKF